MINFQPIPFNQEEALKAGGSGGAFFEGNTEQLVKIARAEFIVSERTGTLGLAFDVFNKEEQKGYFTLWYQKSDGTIIEGYYRTLQAIMGLCGVTTALTPQQATIEKWDAAAGRAMPTQMIVAKELMGKFFTGLFINQFEIYEGEKKRRTELYAPFNQKRQTLQEQRDNAPAKEIERLKDSMLKKSQEQEAKINAQLSVNGGYGNQNFNQQNFNQQDGDPFAQNAPSTTYQRNPAPTNQQPITQNFNNNVSVPAPQNAMNGSAPIDDDIPFAPYFDGVM